MVLARWAARICPSASSWSHFRHTFHHTPQLSWTCCYFLKKFTIHWMLCSHNLTETASVLKLFTYPSLAVVTIVEIWAFTRSWHHWQIACLADDIEKKKKRHHIKFDLKKIQILFCLLDEHRFHHIPPLSQSCSCFLPAQSQCSIFNIHLCFHPVGCPINPFL